MSDLVFQYFAQRFRPRATAEHSLLLFVAPAGQIRTWAGVPRKAFDYQHGFQRTLQPERVTEIAAYFREDARNFSPTSIVIGFTRRVGIEPTQTLTTDLSNVDAVSVHITMHDLMRMSVAKRF